jgi:hypothetical protein
MPTKLKVSCFLQGINLDHWDELNRTPLFTELIEAGKIWCNSHSLQELTDNFQQKLLILYFNKPALWCARKYFRWCMACLEIEGRRLEICDASCTEGEDAMCSLGGWNVRMRYRSRDDSRSVGRLVRRSVCVPVCVQTVVFSVVPCLLKPSLWLQAK